MILWYSSQNPKGFTIDLLDFMGSQAQYLHSLMMLNQNSGQQAGQSARLKQVEMALEGLRNVIRNNPGECEINTPGKYCQRCSNQLTTNICVYVLNSDNFFLKMLKILCTWHGQKIFKAVCPEIIVLVVNTCAVK